jgi:hypothetical protein
MKKKITSLVALVGISCCFALGSGAQISAKDGEVWLGISYLASKRGASAEAALGIGAIGIVDAAAWGFGVGMLAGPFSGMVTGAAVGA